jgi:hypothetical protein
MLGGTWQFDPLGFGGGDENAGQPMARSLF